MPKWIFQKTSTDQQGEWQQLFRSEFLCHLLFSNKNFRVTSRWLTNTFFSSWHNQMTTEYSVFFNFTVGILNSGRKIKSCQLCQILWALMVKIIQAVMKNSLPIDYCEGFESSTRFLPLDKSGIMWFLRGLPYLMK